MHGRTDARSLNNDSPCKMTACAVRHSKTQTQTKTQTEKRTQTRRHTHARAHKHTRTRTPAVSTMPCPLGPISASAMRHCMMRRAPMPYPIRMTGRCPCTCDESVCASILPALSACWMREQVTTHVCVCVCVFGGGGGQVGGSGSGMCVLIEFESILLASSVCSRGQQDTPDVCACMYGSESPARVCGRSLCKHLVCSACSVHLTRDNKLRQMRVYVCIEYKR